ncbi:MAG TPA: phage holin family protein [Candidatus Baltobacteraceae bacterium]|nr:phage holin family protein [Candidatus Baltobacteraceae bacterium]
MRPDEPTEAHRPLHELVSDLGTEISTLVRQELQLARAEIAAAVKPAAASAGLLGTGAIFGLGAFGAATAFVIALIGQWIPVWAAALFVAVVYGIVALVAAQSAKKTIQHTAPPLEQTAQTLKEDIEWAKTRAKSGAR